MYIHCPYYFEIAGSIYILLRCEHLGPRGGREASLVHAYHACCLSIQFGSSISLCLSCPIHPLPFLLPNFVSLLSLSLARQPLIILFLRVILHSIVISTFVWEIRFSHHRHSTSVLTLSLLHHRVVLVVCVSGPPLVRAAAATTTTTTTTPTTYTSIAASITTTAADTGRHLSPDFSFPVQQSFDGW